MTSSTSQDDTQPVLPIDSPTEEEISNLQKTASALIDKIQSMRQNDKRLELIPEAPPFRPQNTVLISAEVHYPPETNPKISKKLENKKSVQWCPKLVRIYEIEATGLQRSTKSVQEEIDHWIAQRNIDTKKARGIEIK